MKKIFFKLFLLLIFIGFEGCQNKEDIKKVAHFYKAIEPRNDLKSEIDFKLSDSTLIKELEKKLNVNLCDEWDFTAKMKYKNIEITFPAAVNKNCHEGMTILGEFNIVEIEINEKNEVLINHNLLSKNESITNQIENITENLLLKLTSQKTIFYSLHWNPKTNPKTIKTRVFEILQGIRNCNNKIATEKFGRELSKLSQHQIQELNSDYFGRIVFNDYFKPIPIPPPPPNDKKNENSRPHNTAFGASAGKVLKRKFRSSLDAKAKILDFYE